MHLGLIGYGNIGRTVVAILAREAAALSQVSVLCHQARAQDTRDALDADFAGRAVVTTTTHGLIAERPDLVVECAGHQGVRDHGCAVLGAGIETIIVSVGALADADLLSRLTDAARAGATRFVLPAGAIGGIDLLSALKPSGIEAVSYTGTKPPHAWKGSPAALVCDLDQLTAETVFFTGTAREAATRYPKNANVAATLALAGLGFDQTQVRLVADPRAQANIHAYSVRSQGADFTVRIEGRASRDNPRTSVTTAYSVARDLLNRGRTLAI